MKHISYSLNQESSWYFRPALNKDLVRKLPTFACAFCSTTVTLFGVPLASSLLKGVGFSISGPCPGARFECCISQRSEITQDMEATLANVKGKECLG